MNIEHRFFRGRVALGAILNALDIGTGSEVAIQAYTCVAVPEGVMAAGARPLWIDVSPKQVTMSPSDLHRKISSNTRAIVVQHTFGIPADMHSICKIASEYGVPVIEDCCHTYDSRINNQLVGTFGAAAFYSFEWGKPLVAGIGGGVTTTDPILDNKIKNILNSYSEPSFVDEWKNVALFNLLAATYSPQTFWLVRSLFRTAQKLGIAHQSYNQTDGLASKEFSQKILKSTSKKITTLLRDVVSDAKNRRFCAAAYETALLNSGAQIPELISGADPCLARFPIFTSQKTALVEKARLKKIEIASWYETAVHPLTASEAIDVNYNPKLCPNAEDVARRLVSFPINSRVTAASISRAASII